jgi:tetratricopeptide (TPR) repeat protein
MSEAKALELKNAGNDALKAGKPADAVKLFTEAIQQTPSNEVLYSNRSAAFAAMHRWEEALGDADKAAKLKPDWSKAQSRRALALFQLNRAEEALNAYKEASRLDPTNEALKADIKSAESLVMASEMNVLGEEFLNKKNYKLAGDHFKKATELGSTSRLYWSNLSNVECLCGRYDEAIKSAEKAIALAPYWHRGYQRKVHNTTREGRCCDRVRVCRLKRCQRCASTTRRYHFSRIVNNWHQV